MKFRKKSCAATVVLAAGLAAVVFAGCSSDAGPGERVGSVSQAIGIYEKVTDQTALDDTRGHEQAETAIETTTVPGLGGAITSSVYSIAYNDVVDAEYYSGSPGVYGAGTSLMGWSYQVNGVGLWQHGHVSPGWQGFVVPTTNAGTDVTTDQRWAILWGDPAIAASGSEARLSNLAAPCSKWGGDSWGGCLDGEFPHYVAEPLSDHSPFLFGGACIARSTDGGQTFALCQCLQATDVNANGDFYDGGHMASSPGGSFWFATADVESTATHPSYIHVWEDSTCHSPGCVPSGCNYRKIKPPFYDPSSVHPRIRFLADPSAQNTIGGYLYAAEFVTAAGLAGDHTGQIAISRWDGNTWSDPQYTTETADGYSTFTFKPAPGPDAGTGKIRTGPQFAFDVGKPSGFVAGDVDAVRLLYTRTVASGFHHIHAMVCNAALTSCMQVPEWNTDGLHAIESDQFGPNVRVDPDGKSWRAHMIDNSGGLVNHWGGSLDVLAGPTFNKMWTATPIGAPPQSPCPESSKNYWGDYDDLQWLTRPLWPADPVSGSNGGSNYGPFVIQGFTDSTDLASNKGYCYSGKIHDTTPMHVSAALC